MFKCSKDLCVNNIFNVKHFQETSISKNISKFWLLWHKMLTNIKTSLEYTHWDIKMYQIPSDSQRNSTSITTLSTTFLTLSCEKFSQKTVKNLKKSELGGVFFIFLDSSNSFGEKNSWHQIVLSLLQTNKQTNKIWQNKSESKVFKKYEVSLLNDGSNYRSLDCFEYSHIKFQSK